MVPVLAASSALLKYESPSPDSLKHQGQKCKAQSPGTGKAAEEDIKQNGSAAADKQCEYGR